MTLAEAQRQYQLALEHMRTLIAQRIDEEDDTKDFNEAAIHLEIAWLQHTTR